MRGDVSLEPGLRLAQEEGIVFRCVGRKVGTGLNQDVKTGREFLEASGTERGSAGGVRLPSARASLPGE